MRGKKHNQNGTFLAERAVFIFKFAIDKYGLLGQTISGPQETSGAWYELYVAWAAENGIVGGVAPGRFAPEALITRQDMATMIYRYVTKVLYAEGGGLPTVAPPVEFTDMGEVADYAADAVLAMRDAAIIGGVMNADGTFRFEPKSNATREQAAKMLGELYLLMTPDTTLPEPVHPTEPDIAGYEHRILTHGSTGGEHWAAYEYYFDQYLGGDALNDAVLIRDQEVEKAFYIKICYVEKTMGEIKDFVKESTFAASDDYDLISPTLSVAAQVAA